MKKPSLKIRMFHLWFRLTRAMTMGVRIFIQNDAGEILLVKHGYIAGWHLPGGGVEVGDTAEETVRKELWEETGLEALGKIELFGVYANQKATKRDHVLLYRVETFKRSREFVKNKEIHDIRFFAYDSLPDDVTESTRNRIDEILSKKKLDAYW